MKEPKPIAVEKDGSAIALFSSIKEASLITGMCEKGIQYRIDRGEEVKGVLYRLARPKEAAALKKINTPVKNRLKALEGDTCNIEAAGKKYNIVSYELTAGRICITPCPYRESPKPKIGSADCLDCPSFHGRNRHTQQVACSAVCGKTWENRNTRKKD